MIEYFLVGSSFAFAAAVQPGPLQAFLLSSVTEKGWKHTLPAAFSPMISDGPIALIVLLVLRNLPLSLAHILQIAGGLLLLFFAFRTYQSWKKGSEEKINSGKSKPRTVLQAAAINILNPNPYLGWSLILGPQVMKAWQSNPANAVVLIASFYGTMVISLGLIILFFDTTTFLGEKGRKFLMLLSAIALAGLGIDQLLSGLFA